MATLDASLRLSAYNLVQDKGKEVRFHGKTGSGQGTYDPTTGNSAYPTHVEYDYKVSPPEQRWRRLAEGGAALEGGVSVSLPAYGLDSTFESTYLVVGMRVSYNDEHYLVQSIEPVYSGDLVCIYNITLTERGKS